MFAWGIEISYSYVTRGKLRYIKTRRKSYFPQILIFLFLILLFISLFFYLERTRTTQLDKYFKVINQLILRSTQLGRDFNLMRKRVPELSQIEVKKHFLLLSERGEDIFRQGEKIKPPTTLRIAHAYLVISFKLRAQGLKKYQPALLDALTGKDLNLVRRQIDLALKNLSLSDLAYSYFLLETQKAIKNLKRKPPIVQSNFLIDENYEKETLFPYLKGLKGLREGKEIHGIAIVSLSTKPRKIGYSPEKKAYTLPRADILMATVEVINQGNVAEKKIKVVATLRTENQEEQKRKEIIPLLKPKEKKAVTFSNLLPSTSPGIVNRLTIKAEPVPQEKILTNNTKIFRFVME